MTVEQAKQFWDEWTAFKSRWKFDPCVTTSEDYEARFSDGSFIRIDSSAWDGLSTGDLKNTETPIADIPTLPTTGQNMTESEEIVQMVTAYADGAEFYFPLASINDEVRNLIRLAYLAGYASGSEKIDDTR